MDRKKISRRDALLLGLKRYFTGKPCKRGHISERGTINRFCIECQKVASLFHRKKDPEKRKQIEKSYRLRNAAKVNAKNARRKAAKLQRTPPWLTREHFEEMRVIYMESEILTKWSGVKHHVDHIVPLLGKNVSGLHVPWNLQVLMASDNLTKHNQHNV